MHYSTGPNFGPLQTVKGLREMTDQEQDAERVMQRIDRAAYRAGLTFDVEFETVTFSLPFTSGSDTLYQLLLLCHGMAESIETRPEAARVTELILEELKG